MPAQSEVTASATASTATNFSDDQQEDRESKDGERKVTDATHSFDALSGLQ